MSLNNIELPALVLKQLYKKNLVELKTMPAAPAVKPAGNVSMLGQNKKGIILLIQHSENVYLPEAELNFLIGILSACQLNLEDTAIINTHRSKIDYQVFGNSIAADKVLLFGVTPSYLQLPLDFPFYQLQQYNAITYLSAPPLLRLMQDKAEKLKLWNSLKLLFSL